MKKIAIMLLGFAMALSQAMAQVTVMLAPNTATVASGGTVQFTPTVIGSTNTAVTWYVCGGTISSTGLYTAPTLTVKTGYCVSAISVADPSKSATSFVTVAPPADKMSLSISINSGDGSIIGLPVVYAYTAASTHGMLSKISMNCGDGTPPQVQNLFWRPVVGKTLTIVGSPGVTSAVICNPIVVGTLKASMTVTDSLGQSATASVTNTTLPVYSCGGLGGVTFGYTLPSWIKALTWTQPADVIYGGTVTNQTSTPDTQAMPTTYTIVNYGKQYCVWLGAGGGVKPYVFSGKNLPPGLVVQQVTPTEGLLTGTAKTAGVYSNVVLTVTDSKGVVASLAPRTITVCVMGSQCPPAVSLKKKKAVKKVIHHA